MRPLFCGVLAVGILVAGVVADAAAGASIVVRTYTQADSEGDIRTARRTAGTILGHAGIAVTWLECAVPAEITRTSDACREPLRWNELVLRILPAGAADSRRHHTLGVALVDMDAGGGSMATVYADRVELMAQSAAVDGAELLGRAMAHEIGHLLLGTNRHASHGLMRASWSNADLRRNLATEWLFGGSEGETMRRGIINRVRR
jgi:hypothetical protein